MQTYVVIIEYYDLPRNGSYGAFVPDVPGCVATGKNIEQALERIRYTLTHFLRATTNAGQPIPLAHSLREHEEQYGCVGEALLKAIVLSQWLACRSCIGILPVQHRFS